jgi:hypothetical protein
MHHDQVCIIQFYVGTKKLLLSTQLLLIVSMYCSHVFPVSTKIASVEEPPSPRSYSGSSLIKRTMSQRTESAEYNRSDDESKLASE